MRYGPARTAALAFATLALARPAAAETFLPCRFPQGGQLRVVVEERGFAIELPGQTAWLDSEGIGARRDPLVAGFGAPLPGEGRRGVPPHDRRGPAALLPPARRGPGGGLPCRRAGPGRARRPAADAARPLRPARRRRQPRRHLRGPAAEILTRHSIQADPAG